MKENSKRIPLKFFCSLMIMSILCLSHPVRALPEKLYKSLDLFSKVLFLVDRDYVEPVDGQDLVYGAIKGMLSTLDPYSIFLTPDVYKELKLDTMGRFGGIGIEITVQNGVLTVVTPIEDSPAARAGVQPGDKIIKINGVITKGMNLADAVRRMRVSGNNRVNLTLYRPSIAKTFEVHLNRETIKLKSVRSELMEGNIAYIRLTGFQEHSDEEIEKTIDDFEKKTGGLKGLILDLRNNPGGLLDQAINVSNLFLTSGVIVSTRGRSSSTETRVANSDGKHYEFPMVVLINQGSASASEIVAAALQDNHRATLIGTKSFGKGSVQTVIELGEGTALKLTVARYYSPSGKVIDGKGVMPDFIVNPGKTENINAFTKLEDDPQRLAAFKYLKEGIKPSPPTQEVQPEKNETEEEM